ncbi:9626_t:CDS:1, partial [Rhizophagus irregularis]
DFAMIRRFKEEQLPAVRISTDEDYRHIEHLYIKSKLTLQEVDEL